MIRVLGMLRIREVVMSEGLFADVATRAIRVEDLPDEAITALLVVEMDRRHANLDSLMDE